MSRPPNLAAAARRACQGWPRLSRPPAGLGLDWPEHGGILDRIGTGGARHIIAKFKPVVLGEFHAGGDSNSGDKALVGAIAATRRRSAKIASGSKLWTVKQTFLTAKHLFSTRPIFHVFCSVLALC
jgi:hypothetical protein